MNEITRFDLDMDGSMEPSEHGRWVRYEDAQRQWVGLTDEEIRKWWSIENGLEDCKLSKLDDFTLAVRAIEAKLKQNNNG